MARRKKGRVPPHLRRYLFKKKRRRRTKSRTRKRRVTMAKRKRRSTRRRAPRRDGVRGNPRRRRGRRRGIFGGGGGYGLAPGREDLKSWLACGGIGWLESKAKAEPDFILNKAPRFVDQVGVTGNLAIVLWALSHFVKNPWLRLGAKKAADITAYQIGRKGSLFTAGSEFFAISGWSEDDVARALQQAGVGSLSAAGDGMMPGVPDWDGAMSQWGEYGGQE